MADITYIAKRSVQAGHFPDTQYQITVGLRTFSRISKPVAKVIKSLSGEKSTRTHRIEYYYQIVTTLIDKTGGTLNGEDMREFLDSVSLGEAFVINDGVDIDLTLEGTYSETDVEGLYYQYSFRGYVE